MMHASLRDKTAIVGVGTTEFGPRYRNLDPELSPYELAAEALQNALDDAGLAKDDVDGLVAARLPSYARMADVFGIRRPRILNAFQGSGRMSGVVLETAVMAVTTGLANVVACVYGNNGRSVGARYGGDIESGPGSTSIYDTMYGMTSPGAYVSLMYRRYQHLYGVPDGALGPLAINNRKNGALNPNALMQKPITFEEYMQQRFIAEPLRLYDYCLINDGGVVFIVTSAERAKDMRKPPVYISGTAQTADIGNFYTSDDFFYASCKDTAERLYAAAGIGPGDVDCAQIYDNFTPTILFSLEGFGYCERGTAWQWVDNGRIELGGKKRGELRLQRCAKCEHAWFPESTRCPRCLSPKWSWFATSGRGTLWSWIVMRQAYFKSFREDLPYIVALIKLEEGPYIMSTITGSPPDSLGCDLPVDVVFEDATDEIAVAKFRVTPS